MNKEFCKYEQALALKELGFDKPCIAYYDAYNGDSHLFFKLRGKYHWLIELINVLRNKQEQSVSETSQGYLEHLEGDNAVLAPLKQQAFRFFREKYKIHSWIINTEDDYNLFKPFFRGDGIHDQHLIDWYDTQDEAESACINKLIEIVKNGTQR